MSSRQEILHTRLHDDFGDLEFNCLQCMDWALHIHKWKVQEALAFEVYIIGMCSLQQRLSNRYLHSLHRVVFVVLEGDGNAATLQLSAHF